MPLPSGWFRAAPGAWPSFASPQRHRVVVSMSADSAREKAKRFAGAAPVVWEQLVEELRCALCPPLPLGDIKECDPAHSGEAGGIFSLLAVQFLGGKVKAVPARPLSFRSFSVPP